MSFSPALGALGWTLAHSLWQGAAAALALRAALALVPAGRGGARYALAAAALGVCLLLPLATLLWLARATAVPAAGFSLAAGSGGGEEEAAGAPWLLGAESLLPQAFRLLPLLWVAASALALVRLAGGALRVRALVRHSRPAPADAGALLQRLAVRMGLRRPVRLLVAPGLAGPAAVGGARPAVLLPARALEALSAAELEAALLHELVHLARRDDRAALAQAVADALLAPSPAARWISARVREEREHRCDDLVVRHTGAPRYVRALARLDELRTPVAPRQRLALAADGAPLVARVRRLAAPGKRRPRRALAALLTAAVLLPAGGWALAASAAALPAPAPRMVIRAFDDAGPFTVALRGRRVLGATLNGHPLPADRLRLAGDSLRFLDDRGAPAFAVRLTPEGGLSWRSRHPSR